MSITYSTLSSNFSKVKDLPTSAVGKLIGGKVEENIKAGFFTNACAIRLSYAFNYSGMPISRYDGATSSGKDKKWYLYRVTDMLSFIKQKIGGTPIKGKKLEDFYTSFVIYSKSALYKIHIAFKEQIRNKTVFFYNSVFFSFHLISFFALGNI